MLIPVTLASTIFVSEHLAQSHTVDSYRPPDSYQHLKIEVSFVLNGMAATQIQLNSGRSFRTAEVGVSISPRTLAPAPENRRMAPSTDPANGSRATPAITPATIKPPTLPSQPTNSQPSNTSPNVSHNSKTIAKQPEKELGGEPDLPNTVSNPTAEPVKRHGSENEARVQSKPWIHCHSAKRNCSWQIPRSHARVSTGTPCSCNMKDGTKSYGTTK